MVRKAFSNGDPTVLTPRADPFRIMRMMGLAKRKGNLPRFQEPLQLEETGRADIRGLYYEG